MKVKPNPAEQIWLDALPDPTITIDASGRLEWANRAAAGLFGYEPEDYIGRSVLDLIHPDDLQFTLMSLQSVQRKEVGTPIEVRVRTARGWRLVEAVGANHLDQDGLGCLTVGLRDLTERRRWEVGRNDDSIFRAVVHNAASLLMLVGADGGIRAVSGAISRLLDRDPESLEATGLLALVCDDDRSDVLDALLECGRMTERKGPVTVEAALLHADGRAVPFEMTFVSLADDPTVAGIVISAHDITKLRAVQRELTYLARTDPLTLLPNRSAVDEKLAELLSAQLPVSVAFVDLDGFKAMNDRFGHNFGDEVLKAVAARLSSTVRPSDLVGRYGGDEFVVVAQDVGQTDDMGRRLAQAMARPLWVDGREVQVEASVGVATTLLDDTVREVLIRADRAMYGSKSRRSGLDSAERRVLRGESAPSER